MKRDGLRKILNFFGLTLGVIGAIMIFKYGYPQPNFEKGVGLGLENQEPIVVQHDAQISALEHKYKVWSHTGLVFIILAFTFQLAAEFVTPHRQNETKIKNDVTMYWL